MTELTKEELQKLAKLSGLSLTEEEETEFFGQLKEVLDYTQEIDNLSLGDEVEASRTINVFRDDKTKSKDSANILSEAPASDENFFKVPKVLK